MKNFAGLALAAAGVVLGAVGPAAAADIWTPPVQAPVVEPVPVEFGSNWYLRGDVGYRANTTPDASYVGACGVCAYNDEKLDDGWMVGVGAGYKFNPWFRADVTTSYSPDTAFDAPFYLEHGDISSWTVMANAYVDLGTWKRITPYVGAGIGGAYNTLSNYQNDLLPNDFFEESSSKWNLAWAVMAGVSYDMTPNLAVDVGYRYLHLGEVDAHDTWGLGESIQIKDLNAHEARVGIRYMLN